MDAKESSDKPAAAVINSDNAVESDENQSDNSTCGRVRADQKRNDEQQYYAAGVPHDPKNPTQQRVDENAPAAGDLDKVSNSDDAPFNKTYGQGK